MMRAYTHGHAVRRATPKRWLFLSLLILILAALPLRAHAILDGFSIDRSVYDADEGVHTVNVSISGNEIRAVAVQPWDGMVIIGGDFTITSVDPPIILTNLARIRTDGRLDTSFAPQPNGPVNAIVIRQDRSDPVQPGESRTYIGGSFDNIGGQARNGLARLKSDNGAVDDNFEPASGAGTLINALSLQPNGSLLVGGIFSEMAGGARNNIARISIPALTDAGLLAAGFPDGTNGAVQAILNQDGMIVIGGSFTEPREYLARFNPDDLLDASFSAEPGAAVRALALQPDGKILLGGDFTSITTPLDPMAQPRRYLARLTSDGKLDTLDAALEPFDILGENFISTISLQSDGKILVGGRFTRTGPDPANPKHHVARLKPGGSLDDSIDLEPDDSVSAIVVQPDGKFLMAGKFTTAGGALRRALLARFYPNGVLDDDALPLDPSLLGMVLALSLQPDGSTSIAGWVPTDPPPGVRIAKLNTDFSLNNSFGPEMAMDHLVKVLALRPDGGLVAGGEFETANGVTSKFVTRLDASGNPDPVFMANVNEVYAGIDGTESWVQALALLPEGSRRSKQTGSFPKDSPLDPGMIYVAGSMVPLDPEQPNLHLVRLKENGKRELDVDFNPPLLDGMVRSIALQSDDKIVIGGDFTGRVMRLETNGDKDESFKPAVPNDMVFFVAVDKEGRILVTGNFTQLVSLTEPPITFNRKWIARLNPDGSVDDTFTPDEPVDNVPYEMGLDGLALQADGRMVIHGFFDQVISNGVPQFRDLLARIGDTGKLEGASSLMPFDPYSRGVNNVTVVNLQSDGKMLIAGDFEDAGEEGTISNVARLSNGWATQELSVSPDGSTITWMRAGTGPEVWGVTFEKSGTPEIAGSWTYLGRGESIDGGWRLGGQSFPVSQNSYVRARGYVVGSRGSSSGSTIESVRLFYLKEPITVKAVTQSRVYGDANPETYAVQYLDANGVVKVLDPASFSGTPTFTAVATATSSVGNHRVTADVSSMASPIYSFVPADGTLIVTKRAASVTPNGGSKTYGDPGPELLSGTLSGFLEDDSVTVTYSRTPGSVAGSYVISASLDPPGVLANYNLTYNTALFTIDKKAASVTPDAGSKVYGAAGAEAFNGTLTGFLESDGVTATYSRTPGSVAGSYTISASLDPPGVLANYNLTYNTALFTIDKKAASVTADAGSKIYGTPGPELLTGTLTGFLGSDNVTAAYSRAAGETVAGGPYTISATLSPAGVLDNYDITYNPAAFTITKKVASVTPNAGSKIYGTPSPDALTGTLTGFLASDAVTAAYSRTAGETVAGSPYTIGATLTPVGVLANYDITYNTAEFMIDRQAASVTAVATGKSYGAVDPALSTESSGFLAEDLGAGKITFASARAVGENATSYAITPTANDTNSGLLANYIVSLVPATFTISKAPLTVAAQDECRSVGALNPAFTPIYTGWMGVDTPASLGGVPSFTTDADATSPAGQYAIVVGPGSLTSTNYSLSFVDGILTVTGGAPQTITFNPMRPKTFGDADFDPGATASSHLDVEYASSATGIASVAGRKLRVLAPGTSEITASQAGNQQYEAADDVTRTLIVNPPPWNGLGFDGIDDVMQVPDAPQLNFNNLTNFTIETWLQLDGSQPDGTGLLSKGEGGVAWSGYQLILHQNRIAAEIGAGTASFGVTDGLVGTSNLNDGQWHHVALSVDRATATASLYLDGRVEARLANPALAVNLDNANPLKLGVDRSGSRFFKGRIDEMRLWNRVRSKDEIRAAVSQIIDPLDESHLAAYYHFDEGDVGLNNAAFTTAPERTANGANGNLQGFDLSGTASNWIRSGAFLPLLETAPITQLSSNGATSGGEVYPNYYPATEVGLCWGTSSNPGLTDSCSRSGGGQSAEVAWLPQASNEGGAFIGAMTGLQPGSTYHVRAFATNQMGTAYGNDLTFQVARLDQSISFGLIADRTYGDAGFNAGGSATSGLPITYTSSNPAVAVLVNGQIRIIGAGSTIIVASQPGNERYNPAPNVSQPFTVNKKALSVTAENKSRAYLAANPALSVIYQGFAVGEGIAVVSGAPDLSTAATPASPVGNYDIVVGLGSLAAQNYSFALTNGTLSVSRAAQSISFGPVSDRIYGDAGFEPGGSATSGLPITYTSSDTNVAVLVNGQIRIIGAGHTVITASQGGNLLFEPAIDVSQPFTVNKKALSVTAENKSRAYLAANPVLTVNCQGFVAGEGLAVVSGTPNLWTAATPASPVGSYHIVVGLGTLEAPNYSFTLTNGILTVSRAAQSISFGPVADKIYGDAGFAPVGSASSGLPVSYTSSNTAVATVVNGAVLIMGAGSTVITASQGGNEFYQPATDVSRLFTVNKKPLAVSADNKSRAYQTLNPWLTASYQGFIPDEDISVITGAPVLSTAASPASPVGSYDIVVEPGTLAAQNYRFVFTKGTLTVFQSCQEIVFPPISDRTYGDAPFEITASSCSGLPISFTSSNQQVARISGNSVIIIGTGSVIITASQGGNGDLEIPPDVSRTLIVHKSGQALSFSSLPRKVLGDAPFSLAATASSGLPVSYLSSDPSVAEVNGSIVTIVGAGTTVITAVQEGDGNYNATLPASQPLTVSVEGTSPLVVLSTLATGAVTADPVLNVMGTASDASGIASLTVNGIDLTSKAELFSSAVPLAIGDNSVTVSAKDGAGNVTTQTLGIVLDATAPAIALQEPADNSVTNLPFFTASGTVAPGSAVTFNVNGGSTQTLPVVDGGFTGSGYLESGVNTIEFSTVLTGRSSRIKRSVIFASDKPFVAITEPGEDIRTEQNTMTIRGIAGAVGSAFSVKLDVDGSVFTPVITEGAFQQQIALDHAGQISIRASVTDSCGKVSVAQRNIIRIEKILGDLNVDGVVDIQDAAALLRISLGMDPATPQAFAHGDVAPLVNGVSQPDGKIDVGDVLVLLRKIVGLVDY